ncbi:hypothetical protein DL766_010439 [Monosporascus sp. MC13-8B]|uniref:cGMP-dependent protein kinase interacting domain-containing protein n=1 Tax=Monosporascus cannonballus TaxID=155416 RepID=A0ABY0GVJ4_9PEZI|nr:hypothetical protein DL762_009804 [Monosporascus cannonballus]RYO89412.1 hypothetical protein DL763_005680 [Monosporascus cannonballus]RYP01793.1 hypothetical protein DL766_010439 [Monosporascus sp. MC13-8B]
MPDLNSVPPSPHVLAASRRASSNQNYQPHPPSTTEPSSINILPSNQPTFNQGLSASSLSSPSLPSAPGVMAPPSVPGQDNTGVGAGPGPIRHPRPLTAAELHSQLEQEQELLVNRLTRDLSLLRAAQNSSVVSNASSASTSTTADQPQHTSSFTDTHLLSGPGFPVPTSRRHHRTSSSASARSQTRAVTPGGSTVAMPISIPQPHPGGSAASVLEAARNPRGIGMSRQNSATSTSHRSCSRNHSPQPFGTSYTSSGHGFSHQYVSAGDYGGGGGSTSSSYFPRSGTAGYLPPSSHPSNASTAAATPGSELSPGLVPATLRYEETAQYRAELEAAKRENEALKLRIKELERLVRQRRSSGGGGDAGGGGALARPRSESASTAASTGGGAVVGAAGGAAGGGTSIAGGRRAPERGASTVSLVSSVGVGVPEEELRVGESAASAGVRRESAGAGAVPVQGQAQAQGQGQGQS